MVGVRRKSRACLLTCWDKTKDTGKSVPNAFIDGRDLKLTQLCYMNVILARRTIEKEHLHMTVRVTSAILGRWLKIFVASHRYLAKLSLVEATNVRSLRDSLPFVEYDESIRTSFRNQMSSANGFPPLDTHVRVTDWFSRISSPSRYPSIRGAPGRSVPKIEQHDIIRIILPDRLTLHVSWHKNLMP